MRGLYAIGIGYLGLCAYLISGSSSSPTPLTASIPASRNQAPSCSTPALGSKEAREWFCSVRASCNALEVANRLRQHPAPSGWDGDGYAASCYALGGRIDEARNELASSDRPPQSSQILFEIGHRVADGGDDVSSGPIMDLVLEFWPENYQAMYHAGMSAYGLKDFEKATRQLEAFKKMYTRDDFFGRNASTALERMGAGLGPDRPNPGAH
ncbi:MAG: hypothetical protein HYV07_01220 [Deltaproteobacteria bacterium]|nr:hypothetical protein [Deltaproteobacteria bacterium]